MAVFAEEERLCVLFVVDIVAGFLKGGIHTAFNIHPRTFVHFITDRKIIHLGIGRMQAA